MQPFNSVITFHSLRGAASTAIQLCFSFLAALICSLIHKQLMLKGDVVKLPDRGTKGHERVKACESLGDFFFFFFYHPSF